MKVSTFEGICITTALITLRLIVRRSINGQLTTLSIINLTAFWLDTILLSSLIFVDHIISQSHWAQHVPQMH